MEKVFSFLAGLFLLLAPQVHATEVDLSDPYKMVRQVADQTFKRIERDQSKITADKEYLKVIVEEELLPYIDYKYASYRVLASYIQKARNIEDPQEKKQAIDNIKRFMEVFKDYLVTTYAGVFTQYTNQTVLFDSAKDLGDNSVVVVKTTIKDPGKPDIDIGFKVRKDNSNQWRAYDMIAEGISLLDAKQSELHGILRQEGIEHVIDLLEKKSKLPVQFRGEGGNE
ncbi:MlaC/ttg2D family ABC transporter substrate-binding protein [Pseudoalteromonas sp. T1lg48]|uniref:MlaC/ttg2D family ABC transporter substrate-binding protein n=1 Tax=Pseudoalteromonas sp. T1lg48 TaxID=2077100 RepID=UPI000CF73CBA|nr:ABC transporter substrate-binding protein [Pseudoalteromonas sp. T1lg48]